MLTNHSSLTFSNKKPDVYILPNTQSKEFDANAELLKNCKEGKLNAVKYYLEDEKLTPKLIIHDIENNIEAPLFHFAVSSGNSELVRYFVNTWGIDVNTIGYGNHDQLTPLLIAVKEGYTDIAQFLLSNKADANFAPYSMTVIQHAIDLNHSQIVASLLTHKTPFSIIDMGMALEKGNLEIVKLLFNSTNPYAKPPKDIPGDTFIASAVKSGNIDVLEYLTKKQHIPILSCIPFSSTKSNEQQIIQHLFRCAMRSGKLAMLRYLVDVYHFDLKKAIQTEREEMKDFALGTFHFSILGGLNILGGTKQLDCLIYLFEEQQFSPDQELIDLLFDHEKYADMRIKAYLQSLRTQSSEERTLLQMLAKKGLTDLDTPSLIKLYQANLVTSDTRNFQSEMVAELDRRGITKEIIDGLSNNAKFNSARQTVSYNTRDVFFNTPQNIENNVQEQLKTSKPHL